uniref:Uncharacterized protein MANES_14G018900 n=1 Tax=Rhizophora mucronata TaxID=61149 RepID=A0A2P2IMG0_RHIMU
MKWGMEVEEIEAVVEKIWDIHDKLSDAIHSISRTHFLNSVRGPKRSDKKKPSYNDAVDDTRAGFVFVKDFRVIDHSDSAVQEAKSLNAIRTALENLEDQLEFFHTVQIQQRAERDAAIARLEQSRIILAMRLAEHQGKKYKVIEEALDFVGGVQTASHFVFPENLYGSALSPSDENFFKHERKKSNIIIHLLISSLDIARKSLKLDRVGGMLGNTALFAISMFAMFHLHQVVLKDQPYKQGSLIYGDEHMRKDSQMDGFSSNRSLDNLDVMSARG